MSSSNWFGLPGELPPGLRLLELIVAKWASQAICAAAELGIPDHLADGPRSADDVAAACGADADATYRLMRALGNVGVLAEGESRVFTLTPVGEFLRSDAPGSMRGFARFTGRAPAWKAWGEMAHSVRTGEPGVEKALGQNLFDYFGEHLEESAIFDEAMTSISGAEAAAVAEALDCSGIRTLADVGGGRGFLLATILARHPGMRGILFDLPHVLAGAPSLLEEHGVAGRVSLRGGSFLETAPGGADAVVMKHILHDWNDDSCLQILRHVHAALPPGGRLLVVEAVVPGPGQRGWAKLLDLEMLAVTPRGRERTPAEFGALFSAGGFRMTRVVPTASMVSVVEGVRD